MGIIISRFRKKETTIEILEGIDKEINRLQKNRKENQDSQKRIATSLLIYSFILYVVSAVIFFCLYFPDTWPLRLLYSLPLLAFPILIWGMRKLLYWYFVKRIHGNDLALRDLRERKKSILEDVMETETYKKAKEILEKFDPARFKRLENNEAASSSGQVSPTSTTSGLHHRKVGSQLSSPMQRPTPIQTPQLQATSQRPVAVGRTPNPFQKSPLTAPASSGVGPTPSVSTQSGPKPPGMPPQRVAGSVPNTPAQMSQMRQQMMARPPGPPMPRSVLPRDRGTVDRLMDYFVGDGPENRYALICSVCSSHNGMALKEEFEFLSFRCCYCYTFNPARKQRPMAPRLEFFTPRPSSMKPLSLEDESSEDDATDEEEEEEGKDVIKPTATVSAPGSPSRHPPVKVSASTGHGPQGRNGSTGQRKVESHVKGHSAAPPPSNSPPRSPARTRASAQEAHQSSDSEQFFSPKGSQSAGPVMNNNRNATVTSDADAERSEGSSPASATERDASSKSSKSSSSPGDEDLPFADDSSHANVDGGVVPPECVAEDDSGLSSGGDGVCREDNSLEQPALADDLKLPSAQGQDAIVGDGSA